MDTKNLNKSMAVVLFFLVVIIAFLLFKYNVPNQPQTTTTTTTEQTKIITPTRGVPPTVAIMKDNKITVLEAVVEMNENGYKPSTVEVSVGGQVRFVNTSLQQVMGPKAADWGGLFVKPNLSFTQVFKTAGTFSYTDINNSKLSGTVVVK